MEKTKFFIIALTLFLLYACKKENRQNGMFNEDGTGISDSMMMVMKDHLKDAKQSADSIVKSRPAKQTDIPNVVKSENKINNSNKKFVFVVLKVSVAYEIGSDYKKYETRELVSDINEIFNYNEDSKAMLEDKVIQNYKMGYNSGDIVSKESFAFDNYSSASKKRNTYIITQ